MYDNVRLERKDLLKKHFVDTLSSSYGSPHTNDLENIQPSPADILGSS
jgi:hypothetical protein